MFPQLRPAITQFGLQDHLKLVATGKVREIYEIDDETLLIASTDRISAYDKILKNGIPGKGAILTSVSEHWFKLLPQLIPKLQTHFRTSQIPDSLCESLPLERKEQLASRCMQVRKLKVFPIEAIVRGYITGSAWKEYQRSETVHGMSMPKGMKESEAFPTPIYTPSTKAPAGGKDVNISPKQAAKIIGDEQVARKIEELSIEIYETARKYALDRGIIIADTKFEFGADGDGNIYLVDEVLTPDSSRFWPADKYQPGHSQESFDKQYLRDWLTKNGLKEKEDVEIPDEVVKKTVEKYDEAYRLLTERKDQ